MKAACWSGRVIAALQPIRDERLAQQVRAFFAAARRRFGDGAGAELLFEKVHVVASLAPHDYPCFALTVLFFYNLTAVNLNGLVWRGQPRAALGVRVSSLEELARAARAVARNQAVIALSKEDELRRRRVTLEELSEVFDLAAPRKIEIVLEDESGCLEELLQRVERVNYLAVANRYRMLLKAKTRAAPLFHAPEELLREESGRAHQALIGLDQLEAVHLH